MLKLRRSAAEDEHSEEPSTGRMNAFSVVEPDFIVNLLVQLALWAVLFDVLLGP